MEESKPRGIFFWVIVAIIAIAAVAAGFFGYNYFTTKTQDSTVSPTKTSTSTNTSLDEPITPEPETTTIPSASKDTPAKTESTAKTETTPTTEKPASTTTTIKAVIPTITAANTADVDNDGKIDDVKIVFSTSMDTSVTSTGGMKVSGYTISKISWINANALDVILKESGNSDTDATPTFTYTASNGKLKSVPGNPLTDVTIKAKDMASPVATSAIASDANATSGIQAGDKITITFSEPVKTNPTITSANINQILPLNNGHSWKDGSEKIGSVSVSLDNRTITIVLSASTSLPTVAINDSIHVYAGEDSIEDLSGNFANNTDNKVQITGSF